MREPDLTDPDNPDWTDEDFARARPSSEVHPPHIVAQLVRKPATEEASAATASQKVAGGH